MRANTPHDEAQRLRALRSFGILDTPRDDIFDALTGIAAHVCEAPVALISFVDRDRQWFKSGMGIDATETPRDISICAHAILQHELFIVPDTLADPRFANNPLVCGEPGLRFYAGARLTTDEGHALGTLCVLDHKPREGLSLKQREILQALAKQAMKLVQLYKHNQLQAEMMAEIDATGRQMALLASTDMMTGLANRRAFSQRLSEEISRLSRSHLRSSLMLADLDHFKRINDLHGHHVGDHALSEFAAVCRDVFRATDVVGRWGGEEFVMLLPDTSLSDALTVSERLHAALAHTPVAANTAVLHLSVSIGLVELDGTQDMDSALQAADQALYLAKKNGRSRTETSASAAESHGR